jgi:protein ImuA
MSENTKSNVLAALRTQLQTLELSTTREKTPVRLGVKEIDNVLPWSGLPRAGIHEIIGERGSALGFLVFLLTKFTNNHTPAIWCFQRTNLYAPGLHLFGLDPGCVIAIRTKKSNHTLWVLEEALRANCLGAVCGETYNVNSVASKRLQLAARVGKTPCLLFLGSENSVVAASTTRWRISPVNTNAYDGIVGAGFLKEPLWRVELLRCQGTSGNHKWMVKWSHETNYLSMATPLENRPRISKTAYK